MRLSGTWDGNFNCGVLGVEQESTTPLIADDPMMCSSLEKRSSATRLKTGYPSHAPDRSVSNICDRGQIIEKFKSDAGLACIPVVVFGACSAEEDILCGDELHADDHITKSVDPDQFMGALGELTNSSFRSAASSRGADRPVTCDYTPTRSRRYGRVC